MTDLWIPHGDYELNYGCACGLPTLRPSPALEDRLRLPLLDQDPAPEPGASASAAALSTAVHIHGFHPDSLAPLLDALMVISGPFDLLISTDSSAKQAEIQGLLNGHSLSLRLKAPGNTSVVVLSNRGRNLGPLLVDLHARLQAYDLVLHLHTKKSSHESIGASWLAELLEELLGDANQTSSIQRAFAADPRLGLVMPGTAASVRAVVNWGANFEVSRLICQQCLPDWQLDPQAPLVFPAGMMFWFRPQALSGLAAACQHLQPLPPEPLGIDGTVLHALERLTAHFCEAEGYHWALAPQPSGGAAPAGERLSVWQPLPEIYMGSISLMAERCRQQSAVASDLAACLSEKEIQRVEQTRQLQRQRQDLMASIARLNQGINEWEANHAVLAAELAAMRSSRSWTLTRPLRQLQQRLQGGAGT
ncbi:rhamnan synthesis F family protein [Synechococcus sp. CS-1329]|uniref:rhamnan synthesis F family protein n=1 Tax=Synechococcus sp. CS-1329 TaxID=2847975 RepID=UPI00223BAF2E|nr:rhamnan synthesis F family protein [Synechococcus sp. CS-1329]MCT0218889.1 rhamnan synthesis F family protein [Synechococcus sp. CS-1329]